MKHLTSKSRVAIAADGTTLVSAESKDANSILCGPGASFTDAALSKFDNVKEFFASEAEQEAAAKKVEAVKTHEAEPSTARVVAPAAAPHSKPAAVKGK